MEEAVNAIRISHLPTTGTAVENADSSIEVAQLCNQQNECAAWFRNPRNGNLIGWTSEMLSPNRQVGGIDDAVPTVISGQPRRRA